MPVKYQVNEKRKEELEATAKSLVDHYKALKKYEKADITDPKVAEECRRILRAGKSLIDKYVLMLSKGKPEEAKYLKISGDNACKAASDNYSGISAIIGNRLNEAGRIAEERKKQARTARFEKYFGTKQQLEAYIEAAHKKIGYGGGHPFYLLKNYTPGDVSFEKYNSLKELIGVVKKGDSDSVFALIANPIGETEKGTHKPFWTISGFGQLEELEKIIKLTDIDPVVNKIAKDTTPKNQFYYCYQKGQLQFDVKGFATTKALLDSIKPGENEKYTYFQKIGFDYIVKIELKTLEAEAAKEPPQELKTTAAPAPEKILGLDQLTVVSPLIENKDSHIEAQPEEGKAKYRITREEGGQIQETFIHNPWDAREKVKEFGQKKIEIKVYEWNDKEKRYNEIMGAMATSHFNKAFELSLEVPSIIEKTILTEVGKIQGPKIHFYKAEVGLDGRSARLSSVEQPKSLKGRQFPPGTYIAYSLKPDGEYSVIKWNNKKEIEGVLGLYLQEEEKKPITPTSDKNPVGGVSSDMQKAIADADAALEAEEKKKNQNN